MQDPGLILTVHRFTQDEVVTLRMALDSYMGKGTPGSRALSERIRAADHNQRKAVRRGTYP